MKRFFFFSALLCPRLGFAQEVELETQIPAVDFETVLGFGDVAPMSLFGDIACEPIGQTGAVAYLAAAEIMRNANSDGVRMDDHQRALFAPEFGDLVDDVRIYYGADIVAVDAFDQGQEMDTDAITFGRDIYISYPVEVGYKKLNPIIAHELVHVAQWKRRGSSALRFGRDYFNSFCKAGMSYEDNKFEKDAHDVEQRYKTNW